MTLDQDIEDARQHLLDQLPVRRVTKMADDAHNSLDYLVARLREAEAERDEQRMEVARALAELQGVGLERNRYREVLEGFVAWERSDFSTSEEGVRLFMLARTALEPKETERLYMLAPTPEAKAAYLRQQSGPTVDLYDTLEPKETQ